MTRGAAALIGLLLCAANTGAQQARPAAPPQPDRPVFRSGVQTIEVDVRVYDRDGRFVADLTKEDFEVLEDGIPQSIQSLFVVETAAAQNPAARVERPADEGGDRTTPVVSARQSWLFVFDLNHLTPGRSFDAAKKAVREFISSRLQPGDLAGVVAGDKVLNNRLTSVRAELIGAVDGLKPRGDGRSRFIRLTREWPRFADEEELLRVARNEPDVVARVVARARNDDDGGGDPESMVRGKAAQLQQEILHATTQTLAALSAIASGLARVPGPKSLVVISDGFVAHEMENVLRSVADRTTRAGARIYAIDVRGLSRGSQGFLEQSQAADLYTAAPMKIDAVSDGPNALAADTGGLFIRNENNLGRALARIADDSMRCYVLTYHASNTTFDGKFRRIDVRVKRPDVRVRARRGYLALDPNK